MTVGVLFFLNYVQRDVVNSMRPWTEGPGVEYRIDEARRYFLFPRIIEAECGSEPQKSATLGTAPYAERCIRRSWDETTDCKVIGLEDR